MIHLVTDKNFSQMDAQIEQACRRRGGRRAGMSYGALWRSLACELAQLVESALGEDAGDVDGIYVLRRGSVSRLSTRRRSARPCEELSVRILQAARGGASACEDETRLPARGKTRRAPRLVADAPETHGLDECARFRGPGRRPRANMRLRIISQPAAGPTQRCGRRSEKVALRSDA